MPLKEEMERQGNWLFRWRSYLPLALLPLLAWALVDAGFARQTSAPWDLVSLGVASLGFLVRILTVGCVPAGTSGRNVARQVAYQLNSTGIYSTVRHPLYLGNFFMATGVILFLRSPWFTVVFALVYWMYYERIMFAEEEYLRGRYRQAYVRWASRIPAIIPSFRHYVPAVLPFSLRTVLRREYPGLLGLATAFTALAAIRSVLSQGKLDPGPGWVFFFGTSVLLALVLRTLKHRTSYLSLAGR